MDSSNTAKVAWITGAGSGVGKATSLLLGSRGVQVLCTDIDGASAGPVADRINDAAADLAAQRWGGLHMALINGALNPAIGKTLLEPSLDEVRQSLAINFEGVFLGTKYAAQAMTDHSIQGSIVITGSISSLVASPNTFACLWNMALSASSTQRHVACCPTEKR